MRLPMFVFRKLAVMIAVLAVAASESPVKATTSAATQTEPAPVDQQFNQVADSNSAGVKDDKDDKDEKDEKDDKDDKDNKDTKEDKNRKLPKSVSTAIFQDLGKQIGTDSSTFRVVKVQTQEWSNGCLGLDRPDVSCTQAITPGYLVVVEHEQRYWVYRTNESGSLVVFDQTASQALLTQSTTQSTERQRVSTQVETQTRTSTSTEAAAQVEQRATTSSSSTSSSTAVSQATQISFTDVSTSYWATSFVTELAKLDIIKGFPDGTFRPSESVTRAQFAAMLSQAFDQAKVREVASFRDVSTSYWAYSAIQEAYETGFFSVDTDSTFNPTQRLTREDVLVALARGLNYTTVSSSTNTILAAYSDTTTISSSVRTAIAALTERGIIVNYPNVKRLELDRLATRAEVAAFIYQSLASTGKVTSISSPYIVGQTTSTSTSTGTTTSTGSTSSSGSTTTSGQSTGLSQVTLTNGYRITYLGVSYGSGTSTWRYRMEELPSAQDLSNWVLGLPSCARVASASPKGEVVNPDPNAKISGIKWQPGGGFQQGEFSVTLNGEWTVGTVDVAAKGPDVARGQIAGPSCTSR